jgi:hypothetical protein
MFFTILIIKNNKIMITLSGMSNPNDNLYRELQKLRESKNFSFQSRTCKTGKFPKEKYKNFSPDSFVSFKWAQIKIGRFLLKIDF